MTPVMERIVELARLTGRIGDPKFRKLMRRLARSPDPSLEQMLLRKLIVASGDECFDPAPFRMPTEDELVVPGTEGIPYAEWGRVAKLSGDAIEAGTRFRFPVVCEHCLFTGMTRKGKSVAVAQFLKAVLS